MNELRKYTQKVKVKSALGLHTRPAAIIVKILQGVECQVFFKHKTQVVNAKSLMSLLLLVAQRNSQITITTIGKDAEQVMGQLVHAFETNFEEYF